MIRSHLFLQTVVACTCMSTFVAIVTAKMEFYTVEYVLLKDFVRSWFGMTLAQTTVISV